MIWIGNVVWCAFFCLRDNADPRPPTKQRAYTLMEFYFGEPDNLSASVVDYCTGVLKLEMLFIPPHV